MFWKKSMGKYFKLLQQTIHLLGKSRHASWLASFSIKLMGMSHAVSVVLAGLSRFHVV
jgi:hypothetical protein